MNTDPVARRDAGLRRLSNLTKGTMAGGLVLTAVVSGVAAHSFSGTTTAAAQTTSGTTATTAPAATAHATTRATTATTATTQLQTPVTAPRSSRGSGRVTSGGS